MMREWIDIVTASQTMLREAPEKTWTDDRLLGYRIVSHSSENGYRTLTDQTPVKAIIGSINKPPKTGLYLGTSKQFCMDYYTGLTDDSDVMLTYEYDIRDVLAGDPNMSDGEIIVKKATLVAIDHLDRSELDEASSHKMLVEGRDAPLYHMVSAIKAESIFQVDQAGTTSMLGEIRSGGSRSCSNHYHRCFLTSYQFYA